MQFHKPGNSIGKRSGIQSISLAFDKGPPEEHQNGIPQIPGQVPIGAALGGARSCTRNIIGIEAVHRAGETTYTVIKMFFQKILFADCLTFLGGVAEELIP